jgi:tetratricopeptide (TPR) repeat protein
MAEATLPLAAQVHTAVARALDWVWPRGAAWAYSDAIVHAPRDPELHFLRGHALGRAGLWREAARSFAAAAQLKPSSAEYQGALVVALDRTQRDPELVDALRRFAELRPGEGEVQVLIGVVLRRCGRKAEALRAFRLAVRLEASPRLRRFVLGETLLGAEGWQEALAAWGEARQIEAASGSPIMRDAGRRSALNFHPGQPLDRVPRRPAPPPPRRRLAGTGKSLAALVRRILRRDWPFPGRADRVEAIRKAWRKTHPGDASRPA